MSDNSAPEKSRIASSSRRNFLRVGAGVIAGAAVAASVAQMPFAGAQPNAGKQEIASLQSKLTAANSQTQVFQGKVNTLQSQSTSLQTELDSLTAILTLSIPEQSLVEAIAETIIPSDSNGAGAKEAGVIYFIDSQLAGEYGGSKNMYTKGPFVPPGQTATITVDGITYPEGSAPTQQGQATQYQYGLLLREFWRYGLQALQSYAVSVYGGKFETLSAQNQVAVLTDLFNNKPTTFNAIRPADFFYELYFMTWSGFLMDPLYGGNRNMVGWTYTAFNGTNQGDFYGEGHTVKELMVASTPTRLQPASLGQFQKGSP